MQSWALNGQSTNWTCVENIYRLLNVSSDRYAFLSKINLYVEMKIELI